MNINQSVQDQKNTLLSMFADMLESDDLGEYLKHILFDIDAIQKPKELPDAFVAHYRINQGNYDLDRATMDLMTWPPMSKRIFELQEAKRFAN